MKRLIQAFVIIAACLGFWACDMPSGDLFKEEGQLPPEEWKPPQKPIAADLFRDNSNDHRLRAEDSQEEEETEKSVREELSAGQDNQEENAGTTETREPVDSVKGRIQRPAAEVSPEEDQQLVEENPENEAPENQPDDEPEEPLPDEYNNGEDAPPADGGIN